VTIVGNGGFRTILLNVLLLQLHKMATTYNLTSHYWPGDVISLRALKLSGDIFATFPLPFLQDSGTNTWRYIHQLAGMLVSSVPGDASRIQDTNGAEIDLDAVPSAGVYVFVFSRMISRRKTPRDHALTQQLSTRRVCSLRGLSKTPYAAQLPLPVTTHRRVALRRLQSIA